MLGSALILGATGQTGSATLDELALATDPAVRRVVAFGCSRKPNVGQNANAGLVTAVQVRLPRGVVLRWRRAKISLYPQAKMEDLAGPRAAEVRGFDAIFIHVGTQRRKNGLAAQIKLELDDTLAVAR